MTEDRIHARLTKVHQIADDHAFYIGKESLLLSFFDEYFDVVFGDSRDFMFEEFVDGFDYPLK
ncbi:MAG: hypothetical protein H6766_03735 [Candidatus Peribacteria bacterium]|nr:MAG: hypothetical protein H6766_03735 [Candidatus Peribacteria bacterium]